MRSLLMAEDWGDIAEWVLAQARAAGAEDAEVCLSESKQFSARVRLGAMETLTEAISRSLELRVFVDQRVARASSSDLRRATLEGLVTRSVERARVANQDPFAGLPGEVLPAPAAPELSIYDPAIVELQAPEKIALAKETETIGLGLDPRIRNSGGAGLHTRTGQVWLKNSRGFRGTYRGTSVSLGLHLLGRAGNSAEQVSDYWFSAARFRERLDPPERVARTAVERVRRQFGARKLRTQDVPVVFEPVLAAELLGDLFGAITGDAIYLRRSFLVDALGGKVAAEAVTIVDDGLLPGGLGTRPFDREGVPSERTVVIENGILRSYLCGTYSARKLKLRSTGNGTGNGEAPTNFYLVAGSHAPDEIIGSLPRGLYVTRLIGQGVNLVTGDYSRGAFGIWIEDGQLAYPVHEITISSNLRRMLEGIELVGSDLDFRDPFAAPTVKIASMTVGGT
jgi:PmbA protein